MREPLPAVLCAALVALTGACDQHVPPTEPPPVSSDAELRALITGWGVMPIAPVARQDPPLVDLGRSLFFDKILSGNRDVSCATCHDPLAHGADAQSLSIGTGGVGHGSTRTPGPGRHFLARNAPSLLNLAVGSFYMFWDGRVEGRPEWLTTPAGGAIPPGLTSLLAAQAMFPVVSREEMRGVPDDRDRFGNQNELAQLGDDQFVEIWRAEMRRLLAVQEYVAKFNAAYPGTPTSELGFQHAANAIAAFEIEAFTRTDTPFDRFLSGDIPALSAEAKRGARLFFDRARCASCHSGPMLGGQGFANAGTPQLGPGTSDGAPLDLGRGGLLARGDTLLPGPVPPPGAPFPPGSEYRFAFRVAPLRNVELTAPYTHAGAYATLEAVVRHYNDVRKALRTYDVQQLRPELRGTYHGDDATINAVLETLDFRVRDPLGLTDAEIRDLVAFLKSLTDPSARDLTAIAPESVPSGLPVRE
jgi:cytochrome c peroxidase